ncbi:MAG TPA: hypothetical protein VFH27_10985, partial [Longimicrobiaceae bacterium]|nr:hypothetical protein [Longimicrobiaceae bacterium]
MTLPLARFTLRLLGRARQSLARARVSARQPRTRMQPEAPAPRAAVPGDACGDAFDAARAF